jgi:endonuclease III-like uncharacterized protein
MICHVLWNMLLDKYTVKKVKNVVEIQQNKYDKIMSEMEENMKNKPPMESNNYLPEETKINMIHELSTYMGSL